MILEMVAWRDPNVVAVKAFYGDDLKVNFCGKLALDPNPQVRRNALAHMMLMKRHAGVCKEVIAYSIGKPLKP